MTTKNRLLAALLVSIGLGAAPAQAAQFSAVCSFGDSLSDAGFFRPFLRSLGIPESLVTQLGSFTTNPDPVWTELIAQFYGITPNPSNAGGCIYAQGGARVTEASASTPPGAAQRPLSVQITEYLASRNGTADPNALYTIWIGPNDFLQNSALFSAGQITQAQFQANVLAAATAEIQQIARLRQAGAQYIMVVGMPDIGLTLASQAAGAAAAAGATQLAAGYNTTLWSGLAGAGIRVIPVDVFALMQEFRANAAAFGLTTTNIQACGVSPLSGNNSSQFCLPNTLVAANANNTFLFADSIHPTGAVHRIFAQFAESMIEGPYNYSQLAELPLRQRMLHVMGVSEGMLNGHNAELGKWTLFASGGGGNFDIESGVGNVGASHDIEAYTLGATIRTSPGVTLGAAFGQTRGRGGFGSDAGAFRTRDYNYSLFASLRWGGFYATGVGTISEIDYTDIRRNIVLGALTRTATASTDGSNGSIALNAGYDFRLGRFLVGPTAGVTAQSVSVNSFEESGGGSAGLKIFEQKRRSEVWSAGARLSFDFEGWTPWIRLTADKERKDDPRNITAMPLTLAGTGNQYDIAAYVSDSSWTTTSAGVRGWLARNIGLSLAYYKVSGRSGIREEGGSLTASFRF